MYVFSSFEHSVFLELAITALTQKGIAKNRILAVPLEKRYVARKLYDTIHRSDGMSLLDGAAVLGTVFMVLGVIYGFVWKWGPILWGLIGLGFGGSLGFLLDLLISKKGGGNNKFGAKATEVVLIVNCTENQVEMVETLLWDHLPLGVARLDLDKSLEREVEA